MCIRDRHTGCCAAQTEYALRARLLGQLLPRTKTEGEGVPGLASLGHDAGVTCEGTDSRCKQRTDARPVSTKLTDYL